MHTIIRNHLTPRDEFIFYSQRVFRLLIEESLSLLPFAPLDVQTPTGSTFHGCCGATDIYAVSIVRAGSSFEPALQAVCKDVHLGKMLIQTDVRSGEPQLHFLSLPRRIGGGGNVLLLDATIASGAAALMAIRVLVDHGVRPAQIVFVCLIAAPQGVWAVAHAFPEVRIVVSEIDEGLNDEFHIMPGIGNFGDRFFGTEEA